MFCHVVHDNIRKIRSALASCAVNVADLPDGQPFGCSPEFRASSTLCKVRDLDADTVLRGKMKALLRTSTQVIDVM